MVIVDTWYLNTIPCTSISTYALRMGRYWYDSYTRTGLLKSVKLIVRSYNILPACVATVYCTNIYTWRTPTYTDDGWPQLVTRHHNLEQSDSSLENDSSVPRLDYVSPTIISCVIYIYMYVMLDINFDATLE